VSSQIAELWLIHGELEARLNCAAVSRATERAADAKSSAAEA
jgi:hypothetical protein